MPGRGRLLPFVLPLLGLVAAGALCLTAVDALRVRSDLVGRPANLDPPAGRGVTRRALGVGDDYAYRRAVALFTVAAPQIYHFGRGALQASIHDEAETALARAAERQPTAPRRSLAANLLGVMSFADGSTTQGTGSTAVRRAIAEFQDAVRADGHNDPAKYNLEVALRLATPSTGNRNRSNRGGRGDSAQGGASSTPTGHGY